MYQAPHTNMQMPWHCFSMPDISETAPLTVIQNYFNTLSSPNHFVEISAAVPSSFISSSAA